MGLLDLLLIALAGIPSTLQRPTLLYCSPQLRLQPLRPHSSYKPHPLCFAYCSHLSNATTDIWPNGDRFRQVPLYYLFFQTSITCITYITSITYFTGLLTLPALPHCMGSTHYYLPFQHYLHNLHYQCYLFYQHYLVYKITYITSIT